MKNTHKLSGMEVALSFLFLAFSIFLFSVADIAFGQGTPQAEICNGKDDNGNGVADENVNCGHYLSYLLDKPVNPISVVLRDQFINPTDFELKLIERLLNPVRKIHEGLTFNLFRPNLHYLAYRLQSAASFVPRTVLIENQFEKRTITVTKPRYLLSPAGKRKSGIPIERILSTAPPSVANKLIASIVPPVPQNANHYLCYDVEPYDIAEGVTLRDQFQTRQFEVIRARYLCNPAEKTHDGKTYGIVDEKNHLMCYEVAPHNPISRPVVTNDQFGPKSQKPVRTEELCLPTVKTQLTLPPIGCTRPDEGGTAVVLDDDMEYQNTGGPIAVVPPTLTGEGGLMADVSLRNSSTTRSGTPAAGETYVFETELLQLSLTGGGRVLNLQATGEIRTAPRTPGEPVQSFDTEMLRLQGQLPPGDPDFDLLRITAGSGFGLPSPGHTTLTQLPGGNWNVDSFFDITYRIDFVGKPGGPLAGRSDSITGVVRLEEVCPPSESATTVN